MEIKIDTEHDSKEQLALLAEFLQKLAGRDVPYSGSGLGAGREDYSPPQDGGLFSLFNSGDESQGSNVKSTNRDFPMMPEAVPETRNQSADMLLRDDSYAAKEPEMPRKKDNLSDDKITIIEY